MERAFLCSRNTVWWWRRGWRTSAVVEIFKCFALSQDGKTLAVERSQASPPRFSIWLSRPGAAPVRYTPGPFEGARSERDAAVFARCKEAPVLGNVADIGRNAELWLLPLPPVRRRRARFWPELCLRNWFAA